MGQKKLLSTILLLVSIVFIFLIVMIYIQLGMLNQSAVFYTPAPTKIETAAKDVQQSDKVLIRENENQKPKEESTSAEDQSAAVTKAEEKQIGYIRSLKKNEDGISLEIDYIQMLTGKEAAEAAIEDGYCLDGKSKSSLLKELEGYNDDISYSKFSECIPNGFYIRNQNTLIRTFAVDHDAVISVNTYTDGSVGDSYQITIDQLMENFADEDMYWKDVPYWITIKEGTVIKITEQYIP